MNYKPAESEARLNALLNSAVDAIITIDGQGCIDTFNPAAERLFQYTEAEAIGRNIKLLMPEPYQSQHDGYIARYQETGKARIIGKGREVQGQRKDGTIFPLHLSVSALEVENRQYYLGIARDLSERNELEQALVDISEKERAAIGQDLHDVLAQQLTALSLQAKTLEKKLAQRGAEEIEHALAISEISKRAMVEAKRLAHGLYPSELEKGGLVSALQELSETLSGIFNMSCKFHYNPKIRPLGKSTELHLYRIAQEAANNALKHGNAKRVEIETKLENNFFRLRIHDNGCGFNAEAEDIKGLGITIMKYRADLIGGNLNVTSNAGEGTAITCSLHYSPT